MNITVARFVATGTLPLPTIEPVYVDCRGYNYHDFMNFVADANEAFDALPAKVREKFGNDQQAFVEFAMDPDNLPQLEKMGLAVARKPQDAPAPPDESPDKGKPLTTPPRKPEKSGHGNTVDHSAQLHQE